jgi:hypothetical protein
MALLCGNSRAKQLISPIHTTIMHHLLHGLSKTSRSAASKLRLLFQLLGYILIAHKARGGGKSKSVRISRFWVPIRSKITSGIQQLPRSKKNGFSIYSGIRALLDPFMDVSS